MLFIRQVVIVATVIAVSGSQAALPACLAFCFGAAPTSGATHHQSTERADVLAAPAVEHQGHHSSSVGPESTEVVASIPQSGSAPLLTTSCESCCLDAGLVVVVASRVERVDAMVLLSITSAAPAWERPARTSRLAPAPEPPASPPLSGALTPLRI